MRQLLFLLLGALAISQLSAQALNRNGKITSTASEYVNKNGARGISGMTRNGRQVSAGLNSSALDFDGTDDYISMPAGVYFSGDFTIECWVYPRSFNNWARVIDFGNGPGSNNVLFGYTYGSSGAPGLYIEGMQFMASETLPLNQWSHIAATLSGTTATIYINGEDAGSQLLPVPANVTRSLCYVGKSNWDGDAYADAVFDDLRIWSTAKTKTEIQASMNSELTGNEPGLVTYFNFNQGTAGGVNTGVNSATDKSPNAGNGTLNNFALSGSSSNWVGNVPF